MLPVITLTELNFQYLSCITLRVYNIWLKLTFQQVTYSRYKFSAFLNIASNILICITFSNVLDLVEAVFHQNC